MLYYVRIWVSEMYSISWRKAQSTQTIRGVPLELKPDSEAILEHFDHFDVLDLARQAGHEQLRPDEVRVRRRWRCGGRCGGRPEPHRTGSESAGP